MTSAESAPKEKSYFARLMRGEAYFDPVRFIRFIAEAIGKKIRSGTIFQRKK